jgi:hypothetical protein
MTCDPTPPNGRGAAGPMLCRLSRPRKPVCCAVAKQGGGMDWQIVIRITSDGIEVEADDSDDIDEEAVAGFLVMAANDLLGFEETLH